MLVMSALLPLLTVGTLIGENRSIINLFGETDNNSMSDKSRLYWLTKGRYESSRLGIGKIFA